MTETVSGKALQKWRTWAITLANNNNVDPYEVDWLLQGLTTLTNTTLTLETYLTQQSISIKVSLSALTEKWQQRISDHTPVQYLTGETPWRDLTLTVTPDVLIPRPETELIIDIVQQLVNESPIKEQLLSGHWADVGTGSGAIALSLAKTFPHTSIHAIDISKAALTVAKQNAKKNNITQNLHFHQGSWLTPLDSLKESSSKQSSSKQFLTGIVSNPPYIPSKTVLTLDPKITNHEPHLALDGGPDGLQAINTLIQTSIHYLIPGGLWLIELMTGQAQTVSTLLKLQGSYTHITIHPDLSGRDRFVSARKSF
ncbi:MAG: peptide chain release factor N(5)-glutamine methyltransferase [Cyanobacteria bacterium J06627_28]